MKRYSYFLRSVSTVSLVVLYTFVTFFTPFSAAAEEISQPEIVRDPVAINKTLAASEQVFQESQKQETLQEEKQKENGEKQTEEHKESKEDEQQEDTTRLPESDSSSQGSGFSAVDSVVCDEFTSPHITVNSPYIEVRYDEVASQPQIMLMTQILMQIDVEISDDVDVVVPTTNNLATLLPVEVGVHDIVITATDSDDCVTEAIITLGVIGFVPSCEMTAGFAKISFDESYTAYLGNGVQIYSGEWFPVTDNLGNFIDDSGYSLSFASSDDIIIQRINGLLKVDAFGTTGDLGADGILDSLELFNVVATAGEVFSPATVVVDMEYQYTECPTPEGCPANTSAPVITASDIVIDDLGTQELNALKILSLITMSVEDPDGDSFTADSGITTELSSKFGTPGTYTAIATAVDSNGCESEQAYTITINGKNDDTNDDTTSTHTSSGHKKPSVEGEVLGATTCGHYITTFIKMGENNLADDVRRLQIFLNDYMGEELIVDGVYGPKTFEAVKRFQSAESEEILVPWGITEPTGIVLDTTRRHINNIMCPELQIELPILYCATTGELIYPVGIHVMPDVPYINY